MNQSGQRKVLARRLTLLLWPFARTAFFQGKELTAMSDRGLTAYL